MMAVLVTIDECEFSSLRETVEVSDSSLSQNLSTLERATYVTVSKRQVGRRTSTWVSVTPAGSEAYARHVKVLRVIAGM
jgi:DNA-binding MarR family transcriptional regulator